jgi:hypothetical protein
MLQGKQRDELEEFGNWLLAVGYGIVPTERKEDEQQASWITIPYDLLIHTDGDKIAALVFEVYPDLLEHYQDPTYLSSRAIVCPNNSTVDEINGYIVSMLPGETVQYISCDTISKTSEPIPDFDALYPTEFLNSIEPASFPCHKLVLKKVLW